MDKKYWVPALERADLILQAIAQEPSRLKLMDLANRFSIHKSSMFSLLHTMEQLQWLVREQGDTYSLGNRLGSLGSAYFRKFNVIEHFLKEAEAAKRIVGETVQLGRLEREEVYYLAKAEAPSMAQITSYPGFRVPAYATAMGKVLLAECSGTELAQLYPDSAFKPYTVHTLPSREALVEQLRQVRQDGIGMDFQESVIGFCCVAAPVRNQVGKAEWAVSFTMPVQHWDTKKEVAAQEIIRLAERLSHR